MSIKIPSQSEIVRLLGILLIDLIGINHGERLCIKVSGIIADGEALKREAAPLLEIRDGSERLILAETGKREYQHEGIRVLDIADWLLSPETGS